MPTHADSEERSQRVERLEPLGLLRLRILSCLGGDMRLLPQYFATPAPEQDLFAAYRAFVHGMVERTRGATDANLISMVAAGRLAIGELAAADDILSNLRFELYALDHGAGRCNVIASTALAQLLPLPLGFPAPQPNYVARSTEHAALRTWLDEQRAALVWNERRGKYIHVLNLTLAETLFTRSPAAPAFAPVPSDLSIHTPLGSHPDVVQRVWDAFGAALPEACGALAYGTPALIEPHSGVIIAIAFGTSYALRIPSAAMPAALAAGCHLEQRWSGGSVTHAERAFGPGWIFGGWSEREFEWLRHTRGALLQRAP